jgi:hypothetical protein
VWVRSGRGEESHQTPGCVCSQPWSRPCAWLWYFCSAALGQLAKNSLFLV